MVAQAVSFITSRQRFPTLPASERVDASLSHLEFHVSGQWQLPGHYCCRAGKDETICPEIPVRRCAPSMLGIFSSLHNEGALCVPLPDESRTAARL